MKIEGSSAPHQPSWSANVRFMKTLLRQISWTCAVSSLCPAVPAFVADRADLISNRTFPLDQMWPGYADYLRSRVLEVRPPKRGF
jgi:hypothetical protein